MMTTTEHSYDVWLDGSRVGILRQRGDYTWFTFLPEYLNDPDRGVLGLAFEEDLGSRVSSALRLPPWFSNLLPEGRLRDWIADDRGVSADREMELLAQVGGDLPGAVRVLPSGSAIDDVGPSGEDVDQSVDAAEVEPYDVGWKFSLAGVGLKFSMVREGDRLTLPAFGEGGDWIVKFPDPTYADVPRNEFAMMTLADRAGLDVPDRLLVPRERLVGVPSTAWLSNEDLAYAVRRFDRTSTRQRIHIEDLAQVRNVYPYSGGKYKGNFETVASLIYRGRDAEALREFGRRVAFNILISNGDAHLKNWSLIYRDRRRPTLSPVYDLVSTVHYNVGDKPEDLGLKFGKTRRFDQVRLSTFARLERHLGSKTGLVDDVVDVVERVKAHWPDVADSLAGNPGLQDSIDRSIKTHSETLLRGRVNS